MKKGMTLLAAALSICGFGPSTQAQQNTNSPDGLITCRVWQGLISGGLNNLETLPTFPNQPDFTLYPDSTEYSTNMAVLLGAQLVGYVWPPASGDYVFYVASSTSASLYLSSDDNPTNKVQIATEPNGLANPREWVAPSADWELQQLRGKPPANVSSLIPLQAGRKYYLEAVGMFDDDYNIPYPRVQYLGVTWQLPGAPDVVNGQEPILGEYLSAFAMHGPVTITNPPSSLAVGEGQPWQLAVGVDGTPPCQCQWMANGAAIDGATNQFLTNAAARLSDSGTVFTVGVTNCFGGGVSPPAMLTVAPDTNPPVLVSVSCSANFDRLFARFSKPVTPTSATNLANWNCNGGLTCSSATLSDDGREVFLDTSPQTPGTSYMLSVSGVRDTTAAGNPMAHGAVLSFTPQPVLSGLALQEIYNRLNGYLRYQLSDLTNSAKFPGQPDYTSLLSSAEITPFKENHGVRVSGWIIPPQSGRYRFYLWSCEVPAELWLSSDENRSNRVRVAWEPIGTWWPGQAYLWTNLWPNRTMGAPENRSPRMTLQAGRKYYFETLAKFIVERDGTGQALTWQQEGEADPASGSPPLSGSAIALAATPSPDLSITVQPTDQTVQQNQRATFAPQIGTTFTNLVFQWFRNGQLIPGATNLMYTTPFVTQADDGATFCLVAYAKGHFAQSTAAKVTVLPDTTPPVLVSAMADATFEHVTVTFSKPVLAADATNLANYVIAGGLTATAALQGPDGSTVVLSSGPAGFYTNLTLTVNGIHDTSAGAQPLPANSQVPVLPSFLLSRGFLKQEVFLEMGAGVNLNSFTNDIKFPDHPDLVNYVTNFESAPGYGDWYAARLSGFLLPPLTGDYLFYVASEGDEGALFLSPDEQPEHAVLIAHDYSTGSGLNWITGGPYDPPGRTNRSALVRLEAGQRCYIEALLTQASEWHGFAVTWLLPGGPPTVDEDPPILGAFLATYAPTAGAQVSVTSQPQSASTTELGQAEFEVAASTPSPVVFFQWQTNGVDVPGANGSRLVLTEVPLSEDGIRIRCVVNVPGATVASQEAVLRVLPDTNALALVSAAGNLGRNQILLTFSKALSPDQATNLANYTVDSGLVVTGAVLRADLQSVILFTQPQQEGHFYTVTVSAVRDSTAAGNPIAPNSQLTSPAWESEEFVGPFPSWADLKRDYGAVGDGVADDSDAIQRALDDVGWVTTPLTNHPACLWVPAGTYRITRTLNWRSKTGVSLFGEDANTTRIVWDGPTNGVMLWSDGVAYHRLGRLALDGQGTALSAIDHKWQWGITYQPIATTGTEYSDLVIQDVQYGFRVGISANDSEVTVARCHFLRCSEAAISTESWNTWDWIAQQCVFEDCKLGITNERLAGHCHAYQCLFLRSQQSDIYMANGVPFVSYRGNTSIGSQRFFQAHWAFFSMNTTFQDNTVIDAQAVDAIEAPTLGPCGLLDNVLVSAVPARNGPAVFTWTYTYALGNRFTAAAFLQTGSQTVVLDNQPASRQRLVLEPPEMPGPLARRNRPVIGVPPGAGAGAIQQAIDAAHQLRGSRAVVHFPPGIYSIDRTLVVPAGTDLQLVGDGVINVSTLMWVGTNSGSVLRILGPSHATVRELEINGDNGAVCVAAENIDQPGARVFLDQPVMRSWSGWRDGGPRAGMLVDRLDNARVRAQGTSLGGERFTAAVIGGPLTAAGQATSARLDIFGYGGGGQNNNYDVMNNGRMLVADCWHEGTTPYAALHDRGEFTAQSGRVAYAVPPIEPFVLSNYSGSINLLSCCSQLPMVRNAGSGPMAQLSVLGCCLWEFSSTNVGQPWLVGGAPGTNVLLGASFATDGSAWQDIAPLATNDLDAVRAAVRPARQATLEYLTPKPANTTDLRLFRVHAVEPLIGFLFQKPNEPPSLAPQPSFSVNEGQPLTVTNSATDPDLPWQHLAFSLMPGAPFGCVINPTNGLLTWTPDQQYGSGSGPGLYQIGVVVTDDGVPALSTTNLLEVSVTPVNKAPVLSAIATQTVSEFASLTVTNTAVPGRDSPPPAQNPLFRGSDVGSPSHAGWVGTNLDGSLSIHGGGTDIWGNSDQFYYYYAWACGSQWSVQCKIDSDLQGGAPTWAKCELMVRQSDPALGPEGPDPFIAMMYTKPGGAAWLADQFRTTRGGAADWITSPGQPAYAVPTWLQVTRSNNVFSLCYSRDGNTWTHYIDLDTANPKLVGSGGTAFGAPWPGTVAVGIAVTAHNDGDSAGATATVSDLQIQAANPPVTLAYLLLNPPAGMTIDTNGVITWTPAQSQSPSTNLITTMVTDTGPYDPLTPHLSAPNFFTVVLQEVNVAPLLPVLRDQNVNELTLLAVTNMASEPNIHSSTLGYLLVSPPAGMSIDANGIITWIPQQTQSPGTNAVTTVATNSNPYDLLNPHLGATNSFTVLVQEVNVAPVLPVIPVQTVSPLTLLTVTNTAAEPNIHSSLSYVLVGPPSGMSIDTNGIITWTPQHDQSPTTNSIMTMVTSSNPYDLVRPYLGAINTFTVVVLGKPAVAAPTLGFSWTNKLPRLFWDSAAGQRYQVQYRNSLVGGSWNSVSAVLSGTGAALEYVDTTTSGAATRFYRVQLAGP